MSRVTVFTPTYNRAYTLTGCYDSLCAQTSNEFTWVIVDDGSTDGTKALVNGWINEGKIRMSYLWQENSGKHVAFNIGASVADGELFICLDSDDVLLNDAIEKIISFWRQHSSAADSAGIIACKSHIQGDLIGTMLPEGVMKSTVYDLYHLLGVQGDKVMIFRTDLVRQIPFPEIDGEKFITEAFLYDLIDCDYQWLLFNEVLMQVNYLPDGYTHGAKRLLLNNPRGFALFYKNRMKIGHNWKIRYLSAVRYINCSIIARDKSCLKNAPSTVLTLLALPSAVLLYFMKYYAIGPKMHRMES